MNADEPARSERPFAAVILAAGLGTRMKSRTPKELQPLAGRPLIDYVLRAVTPLQPQQTIVVLSPAKAALAQRLPEGCLVAWQTEPLGTGHAVAQALPLLDPAIRHVAVLYGDHPLLSPDAVGTLIDTTIETGALVTLLTAMLPDPGSYGRIVREAGRLVGVVEAKDDTAVYDGPVEINSGICCFQRAWLERTLPSVPRSASGEYYLTSLVAMAAAENSPTTPACSVIASPDVAYGVNDRVELAAAEAIIRQRINERLMRAGVAIVDPASTFIDDTVTIGMDARIEPFTTISGATTIGEGCCIGPQAIVRDSQIGAESEVVASVLEEVELGARVHVGPFAHLRPGTRIADDVHIGNYAEIKNSTIGAGSRMGHFSYLGDSEVGRDVNIGAGTVTANYDGRDKHRTVIGDGAFIGVDTMLRAPVTIGPGATTGAGSVVLHDVPAGETVAGVPAKPLTRRNPETGTESTARGEDDPTSREG